MRPGIDEKKLRRISAQQGARFNTVRGTFATYREALDRSKQLRADALASSPLSKSPGYAGSTARELADALALGAKLNAERAAEMRQSGRPSADNANLAHRYAEAAAVAEEAAAESETASHHFAEYQKQMAEINRHGELLIALQNYAGVRA